MQGLIVLLDLKVPHYIGTASTVAMLLARGGLNLLGLRSWHQV